MCVNDVKNLLITILGTILDESDCDDSVSLSSEEEERLEYPYKTVASALQNNNSSTKLDIDYLSREYAMVYLKYDMEDHFKNPKVNKIFYIGFTFKGTVKFV